MKIYYFTLTLLLVFSTSVALGGEKNKIPENFQKENLIAWCIVPFDLNKRTPSERATMLVDLGLNRVAYDWHYRGKEQCDWEIPTFQSVFKPGQGQVTDQEQVCCGVEE